MIVFVLALNETESISCEEGVLELDARRRLFKARVYCLVYKFIETARSDVKLVKMRD